MPPSEVVVREIDWCTLNLLAVHSGIYWQCTVDFFSVHCGKNSRAQLFHQHCAVNVGLCTLSMDSCTGQKSVASLSPFIFLYFSLFHFLLFTFLSYICMGNEIEN